MTVLVSGGAGYIGSAVVHRLLAGGHEVTVFDNLSQGHPEALPDGVRLIRGDLADREAVGTAVKEVRPQAVLHFASHTLVGESMERPMLYLRDNVVCGLNLIEACVEFGVERFVFSSTANLFGLPDEVPISETASIDPGSPYGEGKRYLERVLRWTDEIYGLRFAALRYFNACGALSPEIGEDHTPETHLIPLVLQVALGQRDHITIFGSDYPTPDGTCVRDYVHVADLAEAHVLALAALADGSRTYNLGNGRGFSVREVVEAARAVTGHPIPTVDGDRRPGDPAELVAASDRIREELGWTPRFPDLADIVASAWDWHRTHPTGYVS